MIADTVGTMSMPEVFYGFNRLYISNAASDILLEFSPVEALSLSAFAKREALSAQKGGLESQMEALHISEEEKSLNLIDLIPGKIEVKDASIWKSKDMSKVKDFKQIEVISDWTYSSTYKGNVRYLSKDTQRIKRETSLDLSSPVHSHVHLKVESTEEAIPLEMLGRDNPILHFDEVFLYEDDLGDQGYTRMSLRFRVMKDCFYVLVRYYLRVDEVLVRIYDTRIFHQFDRNYVIREFTHKQSTYDELRAKSFTINSEWSLSKTQSDEVFPHLDLKFKSLDKVTFEQKQH